MPRQEVHPEVRKTLMVVGEILGSAFGPIGCDYALVLSDRPNRLATQFLSNIPRPEALIVLRDLLFQMEEDPAYMAAGKDRDALRETITKQAVRHTMLLSAMVRVLILLETEPDGFRVDAITAIREVMKQCPSPS